LQNRHPTTRPGRARLAQRIPVDRRAGSPLAVEILALGTGEVRVEEEPGPRAIESPTQHESHSRRARLVDRGQRHGVGVADPVGGAGIGQPTSEQGDRRFGQRIDEIAPGGFVRRLHTRSVTARANPIRERFNTVYSGPRSLGPGCRCSVYLKK
jgi:hypothetical protein